MALDFYWASGSCNSWRVHLALELKKVPYEARLLQVSKKEHKSWDARLAAVMQERGERPVDARELCAWARGTWDDALAPLAWGAVAMLARAYEAELPALLDAYAAERRREGRKVHPDGSWEALPDYEIAPERAVELLDTALGVDFGAELTRFARAPRSYRRPR